MKKHPIENMSRRVFLAKSGKLIGLGILAHFSILGKVSADDIKNDKNRRKGDVEPQKNCGQSVQNSCLIKYECNNNDPHKCMSSFTCGTSFTCNPAAKNNCNDNERNKCNEPYKFQAE